MPSNNVQSYQEKGRNVVETLKNSSIYFQRLSSSASSSSSSETSSSTTTTSSFICSRQGKSIEISLNNFYRIFRRLLAESEIEIHFSHNNNNNKKKKKNRKNSKEKKKDEGDYYWIVGAANKLLEKARQGRVIVPSNCLENLDRTIRDKVQLMIQQNKQDDPNSLCSIGILNECFEILKSIDKMDDGANNITDDDEEEDCIYDLDNDTHYPSGLSSGSPRGDDSSTSKENEKDPLVQRGAEVVQELLFSSPYFTPKSKQQRQQHDSPPRPSSSSSSSSSSSKTKTKTPPDRQYDSYKLSDQKFKLTIQKYVPPYMYQRGNPSHIYNCIVYLKENPNILNELLLKEGDNNFLEDLKRTRNDRVFIAIHKFYVLTEEGDCFYKGNDSHLRYIGILDYAHESLSGIKSPKHSVWNIV